MVPPCVMHYLQSPSCQRPAPSASSSRTGSVPDLTNFCTKGTNENITTIIGTVTADHPAALGPGNFANMYDENNVLTLQGVISLGVQPWFDLTYSKAPVLQVQIIDYAYFNETTAFQSTFTQLTPINGSIYYPSTEDYKIAGTQGSVMFKFQVVVLGLGASQAHTLYQEFLTNCNGPSGLLGLFAGANARCTLDTPVPVTFDADPLQVSGTATVRLHGLRWLLWLLCVSVASSGVLLFRQ